MWSAAVVIGVLRVNHALPCVISGLLEDIQNPDTFVTDLLASLP